MVRSFLQAFFEGLIHEYCFSWLQQLQFALLGSDLIYWNWRARNIYNFVRAQTRSYPGAFTTWQGRQIKIWSSRPVMGEQKQTLAIDQVLSETNSSLVNTGSRILEIHEAKYEQEDIIQTNH